MKKLLLILIFIPTFLSAQYTKKELKKAEKWIQKLELRIINRGVDLNETFVFYVKRQEDESLGERIFEFAAGMQDIDWDGVFLKFENAMFLKGLDVGTYEFKEVAKGTSNNARTSGNMIVNGRYIFEFVLGNPKYHNIRVQDTENGNKTVATIQFREATSALGTSVLYREILVEHIIEEFIKACS